jgi:hypothetical protein
MRFYGGSAVGHICAHLTVPQDGYEGGQSNILQDPRAISNNVLENEHVTDTSDPDLEFMLDVCDDDDWDDVEDCMDEEDDLYYPLHVADELFAPMGDT